MKAQVLAFTVLIALAVLLQLNNPAPTPFPRGKHAQSQSTGKHTVSEHNDGHADDISTAVDKLRSEIAEWKQQESSNHQSQNTSPNWLMWSTLVTAAATFSIAVLGFLQWRAMHKQRIAMDAQAEDMHAGLELTQRSIDGQEGERIFQRRVILPEQRELMQASLAETKKAADAATLSAETAKKALEMLERADMIIDEIVFVKTITSYENYITISVKNVGRSKATNVSVSATLLATYDELILGNYVMATAVAPGSAVEICRCDLRQAPWMDLDRAWKLTSGQEVMMIDFTIYFTDIFEQDHAVEGTASHTPWKGGQPFAILYKS